MRIITIKLIDDGKSTVAECDWGKTEEATEHENNKADCIRFLVGEVLPQMLGSHTKVGGATREECLAKMQFQKDIEEAGS